ncbi:MAG: hypothetical protein AAF753_05805 [Pseudomonadota bacterium]
MSLMVDGRRVLVAMAEAPGVFRSLKPEHWSAAAINLAKKQVTAGKQTRDDILRIRDALGADVFEKTLDALKPMHLQQLARRVDKAVTPQQIRNGPLALAHIRSVLSAGHGDGAAAEEEAQAQPDAAPKSNPYLGRKAFRTGL